MFIRLCENLDKIRRWEKHKIEVLKNGENGNILPYKWKKNENDSQNVDKNDCLYVEHNPACENLKKR